MFWILGLFLSIDYKIKAIPSQNQSQTSFISVSFFAGYNSTILKTSL